jgi:hypothetical protein
MIASLSRLFRRSRVNAPAWIEIIELQRRLAGGDAVVLVDVRQPEEFTAPPGHLSGAVNVPLVDLPRRGRGTCRPATTLCWFVKQIAGLLRRQRSYLPPAYGMSPSFVAEPTGGIAKGWLWNSEDACSGSRKSQTAEY